MLNVSANGKATVNQLLLPMAITVLALFISIAFQFTQILRDRTSMHDVFQQQAKPLDDTARLQQQVNALALGTKKLADKGDKGAKAIIERLEANGVRVNDGTAPAGNGPQATSAPQGPQAASAPPAAPMTASQPPALPRSARGSSASGPSSSMSKEAPNATSGSDQSGSSSNDQ